MTDHDTLIAQAADDAEHAARQLRTWTRLAVERASRLSTVTADRCTALGPEPQPQGPDHRPADLARIAAGGALDALCAIARDTRAAGRTLHGAARAARRTVTP